MQEAEFDRRDFMKLALVGPAAVRASGLALAQTGRRPGAPELRFRQVHLDFHTSEHIDGIASQFDPEEFAATLRRAHVNSITCFARGHHGWMYYNTKKFPERRHPHLKRNLLEEQIEVCHKHDIRVPIYITIQWDYYTSKKHPEWLTRDEHGAPQQGGPAGYPPQGMPAYGYPPQRYPQGYGPPPGYYPPQQQPTAGGQPPNAGQPPEAAPAQTESPADSGTPAPAQQPVPAQQPPVGPDGRPVPMNPNIMRPADLAAREQIQAMLAAGEITPQKAQEMLAALDKKESTG